VTVENAAPVLDDGATLLALALSRPADALTLASRLIDTEPDPERRSYAHQAAGIVLRDRGELPAAFTHLHSALTWARRSGSGERAWDIEATLGAALVMAGHTRQGLQQLDAAAATARGTQLARIRLRRAHALLLLERHDDALEDLRRALAVARSSGDTLWEARIRHNRSFCYLALGSLGRAEADADAAETLFTAVGQDMESAQASQNRAIVAARRGDLPGALRLLAKTADRYRSLGLYEPELTIDRGQVLLAAGLATEAVDEAEAALAAGGAPPVSRAELILFCAKAELAADRVTEAGDRARSAIRLFRTQRRPGWEARARLLSCQSRYLRGERSARLLAEVRTVAGRLQDSDDDDAALGHLLAARLASQRGETDSAATSLSAAAGFRRRGSAMTRATGWLAVAMQAAAGDRQARLLAACRRGLDALDEHRMAFGAAELRAMATGHARDLTSLAVAATTTRSPRLMLEWAERSRATSLAEPSVRPTDDHAMQRDLAALRDAAGRLEKAHQEGTSTTAARQQRDAWEAAVRERRRQLSGSVSIQPRFDIDRVLAALGDTRLVVLVESQETLHGLTVANGRVRRQEIGPAADALRELRYTLFALRRAAYLHDTDLARCADRLQHAVLGPVARLLEGGPVVVVPPAALQVLPWSLLPALANAPLSVAPSALMWLRAAEAAARPHGHRRVTLVAGPGLASKGSEVAELAAVHRTSTVLGAEVEAGASPATVDAVLASMSGAWVAHVAAHGSFRSDSPLFSSLRVDDGAMYVHDLDQLRQPPRQMVLSACDGGVSAPVGADETLGLVSSLLRIGTLGVLASVVPVNDASSIPFMLSVHRALAKGKTLPEAALQGRRDAETDPLHVATAASFSVWGS
jgi:tetratricopeptide (TPR) repeat protein